MLAKMKIITRAEKCFEKERAAAEGPAYKKPTELDDEALAMIERAEKKANAPRACKKNFNKYQLTVLQARLAQVTPRRAASKLRVAEKHVLGEHLQLSVVQIDRWIRGNKVKKPEKTNDEVILKVLADIKTKAEVYQKKKVKHCTLLQNRTMELRFQKSNRIEISEREALGAELGMDQLQIKSWFERRNKEEREENMEEEEEEEGSDGENEGGDEMVE